METHLNTVNHLRHGIYVMLVQHFNTMCLYEDGCISLVNDSYNFSHLTFP